MRKQVQRVWPLLLVCSQIEAVIVLGVFFAGVILEDLSPPSPDHDQPGQLIHGGLRV